MTLQVLISTMHQSDYSLLEKMNIQSDAIVINQSNKNEIVEFDYKGHNIKWISLCERGIGLSRNTALMRATADIVLFADDDVVYNDGYADKIISTFEKYPKAGLIIFGLIGHCKERVDILDKKDHRLNIFNCLKYGAFRIALRRDIIIKHNIYFSLLFGGGAKYQAGEDNKFITDCILNNILCIGSKEIIGDVFHSESTWFKGYNEKFYLDEGSLFASMYGKWAKIMLFLVELKNFKRSDISFSNRLKLVFKGANDFRK